MKLLYYFLFFMLPVLVVTTVDTIFTARGREVTIYTGLLSLFREDR